MTSEADRSLKGYSMEQIAPLLEELAKQLGTTVEYLWPILIAKTKMDWLVHTVISGLFAAVSAIVLWRGLRLKGDLFDWEGEPTRKFILVLVGAIVLGVSGLVFLGRISDLSTFFDPEAAVIRDLMP